MKNNTRNGFVIKKYFANSFAKGRHNIVATYAHRYNKRCKFTFFSTKNKIIGQKSKGNSFFGRENSIFIC